MKIALIVARILLGLIFLIFGLNGFLNFLHMPMPPGPAGQYMGVLFVSHYLAVVFLLEIIGGALLLVGPVHPAGAGFARPGDVQHPSLSRVSFSRRFSARAGRGNPVVHCLLRSSPGICRNFRAEGVGLSYGFWDWPRYTAHPSAG